MNAVLAAACGAPGVQNRGKRKRGDRRKRGKVGGGLAGTHRPPTAMLTHPHTPFIVFHYKGNLPLHLVDGPGARGTWTVQGSVRLARSPLSALPSCRAAA